MKSISTQLKWEKANKQYNSVQVTINSAIGRYIRMQFDIASAPAIWQRTIEEMLQGILGVSPRNDLSCVTFSGFGALVIAWILSGVL
jgi:hypothetical protein